MTIYSLTRTVFRVASLDLLDLESGGETIWGRLARDASDMLTGNVPPAEGKMGPSWLRTRVIVRVARACMAAFTRPYPVDDPVMDDALGDVPAASLIGTPFAYYRKWWRPPAAAGVSTTRRMTTTDVRRRVGLEVALKQQANSADSWRHVHEDVTVVRTVEEHLLHDEATMVRTTEPAEPARPTRPYMAAVIPTK
jgi:hypothetical protein